MRLKGLKLIESLKKSLMQVMQVPNFNRKKEKKRGISPNSNTRNTLSHESIHDDKLYNSLENYIEFKAKSDRFYRAYYEHVNAIDFETITEMYL